MRRCEICDSVHSRNYLKGKMAEAVPCESVFDPYKGFSAITGS